MPARPAPEADHESDPEPEPETRPDPEAGAEDPTADDERARRPRRRGAMEPPPKVPDELPVLPLRNVVVFPLSFLPLSVGQPRSVRLVEEVMVGARIVGLFASQDPELPEPPTDKIHPTGTAAYIHRMVKGSDGQIGIFVQGLERIRADAWLQEEPYLKARVSVLADPEDGTVAVEALRRSVVEQFNRLVELVPHLPEELSHALESLDDPRALAYFIAANTRMEVPEAQRILAMDSVEERLRALVGILSRELEVLEMGRKIQSEARGEMEKMQREFFLRQQLKAIRKELGEDDEGASEIDALEGRIRGRACRPRRRPRRCASSGGCAACRRRPRSTGSSGPIWTGWSASLGARPPRTTSTSPMPAGCWTRTTTISRTSRTASWSSWPSRSCDASVGRRTGRPRPPAASWPSPVRPARARPAWAGRSRVRWGASSCA